MRRLSRSAPRLDAPSIQLAANRKPLTKGQELAMHKKNQIDTATVITVLVTGGLIGDVDELEAAIQAIMRVMPNVQMILLI